MHFMWFKVFFKKQLTLQLYVYKLGIIISKRLNFLKCHCIMLQQPICGITISCAVCEVVVKVLSPIVYSCTLNQSHGQFVISTC